MMDEDQWTYDNTMSQEIDMDYENEQECGVNEPHVDCSDAFNTSQVFGTRDDVLLSDTHIGSGGRTSFVLIGCERSGQYKCRKKEFVRRDIGSRKCGCPFKLHGKPMHGWEGWMVKLICGIHNHELVKSLVRHSYVGRLTKDEKNIIADMTKSMVKPRNILLTLKEHNANRSDTEMQHLMKLLERDQYIHWHRFKDEVVVCDLFWCHPNAMKLCNACHLMFFIDSTYKTNRYRLPLLDFVGMIPTGMTFSVGFPYLEGEHVNNIVWALERFRGLFLRRDRLPVVIVTNRDLALMNAVKTVFLECTNLLCRFHIDKNVKAKCKSLIDQKNVWEYVMDNWGTLVDCPSEQEFPECLQKFQMACSPWPMYALNEIAAEFECVHYAGNNPSSCSCVMRSTHGLPCACELSRYAIGSIPLDSIHMFWRRLSFSDQGLCEAEVTIKEEIETISKRFEELDAGSKDTLKKIAYPNQNSMCPLQSKVNTKGAPKKSMNRSQRSTKRDPSYGSMLINSSVKRSASSSDSLKPIRIIPMLDQFEPFIQGFIHDIMDVKADGNCGYRSIVGLLGMGEDSWSLVCNELIKELGKWSHDYINLFGGTERFEELRLSLLVDGCSKVSVDKWMDITEMRYVIASRYNVILVSLSRQQSMTFFPLRSQPPPDSSVHRMICVGHVFGNHFVQVYLKDVVLYRLSHCCGLGIANLRKSSCQLHILDEIYYRQPFTDTCNQIRFQCMQLKNDDGVNTMLMYNHQFSRVGLIELLCTIGRTPDEILNLLEGTMTPTHDALLYYNERWNMPRQNNFEKIQKEFDIPSGCTIDKLKDLIKQVAPQGIPPHGIHELQTVRQLFFRQPGHFEYSDKVIKFEIIELKTNDDVLKVMKMEDDMATGLNASFISEFFMQILNYLQII
ncbi:Protein FAR1-RELATED SEQUENCE 5 [Glycine soja]